MLLAATSTMSMSAGVRLGACQRLAGCGDADLGLQRQFLVGALVDARRHALRVEDAGLFHHVARLDAGGFLDEGAAGRFQRGDFAGRDLVRVLGVEQFDVSVKGRHQLVVGDRIGWREQAGAADDDRFHGWLSNVITGGNSLRICRFYTFVQTV
jgi:hypothetical protein